MVSHRLPDKIKDMIDGKSPSRRTSNGAGHNAATTPGEIQLTFFRDLTIKPTPKLWLIKNVMARGEVSSWIGKPGGGKSGLLTDISVHGAPGQDWRGYRTPEPFGSVYFALERGDLTLRRLAAHRIRDGLPDDLPIAVANGIIDLIGPSCVDIMVDAIKRAQDGFGREVGLAVIDTRSKGIAAGGGDEDKARFQNIAAANLRRVIERTRGRIHIASVGHTGKEPRRGERGSNATLGDVDLEVTISGDAIRTAEITKANDQALGVLTSYDLEPYELGTDEDGQPYRTFIVGKQLFVGVAAGAPKRGLSSKQKLALEALTEVVLRQGQNPPAEYDLPDSIKIVSIDAWRDELYRRNVIDPDGSNPRSRLKELREPLQARHFIGVRDTSVWLAR